MKKVSAFAVFKAKKDRDDTPKLDKKSSKITIKKASSTMAIPAAEEDKMSSRLLRAIKGGSFRNTIRGNKHRPNLLADGSGNSPFVAGDGMEVKLTSVKDKDKKQETTLNASTDNTPPIPRKTRQTTNAKPAVLENKTSKQRQQLPPLPNNNVGGFKNHLQPEPVQSSDKLSILDRVVQNGHYESFVDISSDTSKDSKGLEITSSDINNTKNKIKRDLEDASPESSLTKKKRLNSPNSVLVQAVVPQTKDKGKGKKVDPNMIMGSMYDSTEEAKKLFDCMIHPVQVDKFLRELWQKKPLLVRRHISHYNDGWFSTEELDRILEKEDIQFGVNLDVTSYIDGQRETHNPVGRAYKAIVWDFYKKGCSVRMLNPQTYSKNVWKMLSTLQEYFGCFVGANIYLTPPGTQGFAPHYDDIEAFVLQLEGKKHWKLYNPISDQETLPRESSRNYSESEIGTCILDVTLHAGDLLYFPRGFVHQAHALEDVHSLHITVSCFQKNTWGDLLQKLLPRGLEIAMEEDIEFRQGLPLDYLGYMGLVNSDVESPKRDAFIQKTCSLMAKMIHNYCPIDVACDQLGKQFIQDSLPPVLTKGEKSCSIHGHGERWDPVTSSVKGATNIQLDTMIKLIRKGCIRMITEDDAVRIYHNLENARVYHGKETQYVEVSAELAPVVEFLFLNYPEYVLVNSLPTPSVEDRVELANVLYDKGLIIVGEPLSVEHVDIPSDNGSSF